VPSVFVGRIVNIGPLTEEVDSKTANSNKSASEDERVVNMAVRVKPFLPVECNVQVCKENAEVEVGAPGERVPMHDRTPCIEAQAFPRCLDLVNHYGAK
jgi:hypothetical protein